MKQTKKNKKQNQPQSKQGAFKALLDKPTRENSSGFAFSFAAVFIFALSLIVSLILAWTGFNPNTDSTKDWYLYVSFSLAPAALLLAGLWYFYRTKKSVLQTLKKQVCHWKYYLIAIVLQIGLFSVSYLNTLFAEFLGWLGFASPPPSIPSLDGFGFVGVILVVALLPAIFEEILFRGIVLDGAYAYGTAGAVLLCGGLFALYHQNPLQTVYPFVCGAAFALLAIRSRSVFPTMLAHFLNNLLIIILEKAKVTDIPNFVFIPVIILSGLCLLGTLGYLIFADKNRLPDEEGDTLAQQRTKRGVYILAAAIGILICFVGWTNALYTGFVGS